MGKYVLLLLALPVAELFVLVRLAEAIGGLRVFLIVLASGLIGAQVARMAGWQVIAQSRKAFASGTLPSATVLNGALLFLAALLLLIPGLITDALAMIVLLIPWSRRVIGKSLVARIERAVAEGKLRVVQAQVDPWRGHAARRDPSMVIDAEGETVESRVIRPDADSPPPPRLGS